MSTLATSVVPSSPAATKTTILIVEDTPFWQKQIEQAMQGAGYATIMAGNGAEALALVEKHNPALIVSDIEMPQMTGLEMLNALRAKPQWQKLPVILLTTGAAKERIIEATRLKAAEYMLKGSFSADQLADRVKKWLARPAKAVAPAAPTAPKAVASAFPRLLQRNEVITGITTQTTSGKTLPNVVGQLAELCKTAASNATALLELIKSDPVISMRVMQLANATKRIGTLDDAIRAIGPDAIREMSQSLVSYPSASRSVLSAWQHSVAVASVMHKIVPRSFEISTGVAYLIGLLHDLPEILLRQAFPAQYEAGLDFADQASRPLRNIAPEIFGVSMSDIANELVTLLKLPPLIGTALREYAVAMAVTQDAGKSGPIVDRLAMAIRFAEYYANAMQMPLTGAPADALIAPLTLTECRAAYVSTDAINGAEIRSSVVSACEKLSGTPTTPPENGDRLKLWYTRHNTYAPLDPVEEALKQFADLDIHPEPPNKREQFADLNGVVVCAPAVDAYGLLWHLADRMPQDATANRINVLYIVPPAGAVAKTPLAENIGVLKYPFCATRLKESLQQFR